MKKMLEKLDFHLPVIRCFAFKVLQRQKKILLRNSLFLEAKQQEGLALLLCSTLLKANVLNPSLFSGLRVLFSTLHCLPSLLAFFFFSFLYSLFPSRELHFFSDVSLCFLFTFSRGFVFFSPWLFLKGWFGNIIYWQGTTHSWLTYLLWQPLS